MLKNKTYLLTGASGGIGRAIAKKLSAQQASLILVGRSAKKLQALAEELHIERFGGFCLCADIATQEGLEIIRTSLMAMDRSLDGIIHCAGVNYFGFIENTKPSEIHKLINTNITSTILLTRIVLPFLNYQDSRIVFIGSSFGALAFPGFSVYSATKFAVRGFAQALRRELADTRIQVACLAPRATKTELNSDVVCAMNNVLGVHMDDPEIVASVLEKMLSSKRMHDRNIGWPERFFIRINSWFPSIIDNALRKQLPIIARFSRSSANLPVDSDLLYTRTK